MAHLNRTQMIGNLTRDPEVRYTPKGTAVTDVGIALNRISTSENGEKQEETTFVDVTFWGRQAETLGQYAKKGAPLFIEGRLQMDTWQDKQTGQNRSRLKVVGENFQFLGGGESKPKQQSHSQPPAQAAPQQPAQQPANAPTGNDDDIPF